MQAGETGPPPRFPELTAILLPYRAALFPMRVCGALDPRRGAIGAAPWGQGFGKCWARNGEQNSFPQDFSEPLGAVHTGPGGEL